MAAPDVFGVPDRGWASEGYCRPCLAPNAFVYCTMTPRVLQRRCAVRQIAIALSSRELAGGREQGVDGFHHGDEGLRLPDNEVGSNAGERRLRA